MSPMNEGVPVRFWIDPMDTFWKRGGYDLAAKQRAQLS